MLLQIQMCIESQGACPRLHESGGGCVGMAGAALVGACPQLCAVEVPVVAAVGILL